MEKVTKQGIDVAISKTGHMDMISVENAVVRGHHAHLSGVNVGDIYDCFPETNFNIHDPHAISVINMLCGSIVARTSPCRICRLYLQPFHGFESKLYCSLVCL